MRGKIRILLAGIILFAGFFINGRNHIVRPDERIPFETDSTERYERIFGGGETYKTKSEADRNVTEVTVPVWHIEDGRKQPSAETLTVNKALADEIYDIFYEIYTGSEKFPIKSVYAYSWRNTAEGAVSQHSYGTAVDINPEENYCVYKSGKTTGSFWKPYENPYSLTADGDVVKAFSKYGWTWGAEWDSPKDYMHFSYLGG